MKNLVIVGFPAKKEKFENDLKTISQLQKQIGECDQKIEKYKEALEGDYIEKKSKIRKWGKEKVQYEKFQYQTKLGKWEKEKEDRTCEKNRLEEQIFPDPKNIPFPTSKKFLERHQNPENHENPQEMEV